MPIEKEDIEDLKAMVAVNDALLVAVAHVLRDVPALRTMFDGLCEAHEAGLIASEASDSQIESVREMRAATTSAVWSQRSEPEL